MFGVEGTDNLHFAVYAKQLGAGLDEQLEKFIREHTVLLCFMLFKTGSIARSIFNAH